MISQEIRKLIIRNAEEGVTVEEMSRVLHVGKSTIWKLLKQKRETGSIESHCHGRKSSLTAEQYEKMIALVEAQPDITLEEIREHLELPIHKSQISYLLRKAGYRFKKMVYAQERDREDVKEKREQWLEQQPQMNSIRWSFWMKAG